jgi:hypothetical protein
MGTRQDHTQAHIGQYLATLGRMGLAAETPLELGDGRAAVVGDLVTDLLANQLLAGEIYWDAVAIALYLPPRNQWTNRLGDRITMDLLVDELLHRPYSDSPCAGCHIPISLAVIARADQVHGVAEPSIDFSIVTSPGMYLAEGIRRFLEGATDAEIRLSHNVRVDGRLNLRLRI